MDHRVGIFYNEDMKKHKHTTNPSECENPTRILSIWEKLASHGILQRCVLVDAEKALDEQLLLVHTPEHIEFINTVTGKPQRNQRYKTNCDNGDVYFNKHSSTAARFAAGGAIQVARGVADEELSSAFAIVRPPGHHAERDHSMGFCLYNNVAVAASFLLRERAHSIRKILIVDWDIHHGNGTQHTFYEDDRVLFFSVHRHGLGFFPETDDGSHDKIGDGKGVGFNINVPWENKGRCDADYLAVWEHILIPVAREFKPDIVLVSAGFDAAKGDPLGDCNVTPEGFAIMLQKLSEFAGGKLVLVLEGGYKPDSLADCVLACVEVLTHAKEFNTFKGHPSGSTYDVIKLVRQTLSPYWSVLADELLVHDVLDVFDVQQDSFMDPDPIKARRAAVNIARRLIPPAAISSIQIEDREDLGEQLAQEIAQLQLLSLRLKDSKDTADRPESSGS